MKKYLFAIVLVGLFSCEKTKTNENDYVDITYEVQTDVTGFHRLKYGNFYALSNGFTGIVMEDWTIPAPGNFTKTVSIRKGFIADLEGAHDTSNNWSLKIRSSDGSLLATGTPVFDTDSSYYHLTISAHVK